MGRKKHILVIRLSAMGDVAMTVPVLRALVAQHPNVKVTVVSRAYFKPFFEGIPRVNFFTADIKKRHKGLGGLLKLFRELNELHFYAVADLHNVLRSRIITRLFAFRNKKTATTDKARAQRKALTRSKNKVFEPLTAITQRHAETFAKLGFPVDLDHPVFPEKKELTPDVLKTVGKKEGIWIGIAPFAQHRSKMYPNDLLKEVLSGLSKQEEHKIFLFGGGQAEIKLLKKIAKNKNNVMVVAGKLTLRQELQLISNLDVMLSMDSGNAHIAAMLGTKVVTLWGATHPYAGFAPFNQPLSNALLSDREKYPMLPTSVYGNKKVAGYEDAMRTILPDTVIAKVKEVTGA